MIYFLTLVCHPQVAAIVRRSFKLYDSNEVFEKLRENLDQFFQAQFSKSALNYSVENECMELLRLLTIIGTDLNTKTSLGETPLHVAIRFGHEKIVQFFLDEKVDITIHSSQGISPIQYALIAGRTNILKLLLTTKFNVTFEDDIDVVKFLLNREDEIIICGTQFSTLLFYAVRTNDETFNLVLPNCSVSNINAIGPGELTLLNFLIESEDKGMINLLLDYGLDVNIQGEYYTPLIYAVDKYPNMVAFILQKGANVNLESASGFLPIHIATFNMHEGIIKLLLKYGADINSRTIEGMTGLHLAFEYSKKKIIQFLLNLKSDVNAFDVTNCTPLELGFSDLGPIQITSHFTLSILAKMANMRANKEYVSEHNINFIERNEYLRKLYKKCENEFRRMQMRKFVNVGKYRMSDFLTSDLEKLTTLARNNEAMKTLKGRIDDFPFYRNQLQRNMVRAKSRFRSVQSCVDLFSDLVKCDLPFFIFDKICGYLSDYDLKNLAIFLRN